MAHFYATIRSKNTTHTKCGTARDGMTAELNGWNIGCRVELSVDENGKDTVRVYRTDGSNGNNRVLRETFTEYKI